MAKATTNQPPKEENEGAVARKNTEFVLKDIIVRKKKNPQQKMERYFEVKKPKSKRLERNFQGFPVTECVYEEEVNKLVYKPPGYPSWDDTIDGPGIRMKKVTEHKLCPECFLRPCLVKGKWDDIMGFCEDIMVFENDDSEGMYSKLTNHAESIMVEIFGAKYAAHTVAPGCVYELIGKYHNVKSGMEAEGSPDEHPDDELVANAIDGGEYLPLQSNSP